MLNDFVFLLGKQVQDLESGSGDVVLPHLGQIVDLRHSLQPQFVTLLEEEEQRRTSVQFQKEGVLLQNLNDLQQLSSVLDSGVGKDHFSLKGTILATNLELFGVHLHHVQVRVFSTDEVDGVGKLLS